MNRIQQGYIFLMTLMIIAVISLLVLASLQHILLFHKAITEQEKLHQDFYQLEEIAAHLARQPVKNQHCIKHQDAANAVFSQLLHHQGCSLRQGTQEYRYFIEEIGTFPCLLVRIHGLKYASHHRRISVMALGAGRNSSFLQLRFIQATNSVPCATKEREIASGISSWRYFASVEMGQ